MSTFKGSHVVGSSGVKMADVIGNSHPTVLHFARELQGLSHERLSAKTGIGEQRLRDIETTGFGWTSPVEAAALQRTFGVPEKELLEPGTTENCYKFVSKV
jgi:ribosome-binding protein aMBF1 (putative translation factor)